MKFRGHIQHGQIVVDEPMPLKDGTAVVIEASEPPATKPVPGSLEAILGVAGTWAGDPAEVDRFMEELRREKRLEVEAQLREQE